MKTTKLFLMTMVVLGLGLGVAACDDDDDNGGVDGGIDAGTGGTGLGGQGGTPGTGGVPGTGGTGTGGSTDAGADTMGDTMAACGAPSPTCAPALGAQIDRLGRAGVNTALTDPFWDDTTGPQRQAEHKIMQDKYNQASNPATWGMVELSPGKQTSALIRGALAAYDSLDGTSDGVTGAMDGCGNQLAYSSATNYAPLTGVLVDDRLYVNTASGTCGVYLAVEANALMIANTDCGGRTPLYNTIDITYTALVNGSGMNVVCTNNCAVTNGIKSDADPGAGASLTTFPFLGAPL